MADGSPGGMPEGTAEPHRLGSNPRDAGESADVLSRRVQMLATEHWGLLAARSTAQSEVLTRITIYLTLVSASLLTIGVLGQATRFGGWFPTAALLILGFLSAVGTMTATRVSNVSEEDLMYVVAMNRLRAGYVELDPALERYFMSAFTDDMAAMKQTYSFLRPRGPSVGVGSSAVLIILVNACVVGLFVGGMILAFGGPLAVALTSGVLTAVTAAGIAAYLGYRTFRIAWQRYRPLRPTRAAPPYLREHPET
jgi:hypothetical protein